MKSFEPHDHRECVRSAIATATRRCADRGLRLTPQRRRVLEILLASHKAMGAYEVLDVLRAEGLGSQPPVVYRALDFLVENGLAHRIERLNAFVACARPESRHAPAFLVCRACATVAETDAAPEETSVGTAASEAGFEIERTVVEAFGLCPACRAEGAP